MKAPYRITNQSKIIYKFITAHKIDFSKVNDVKVSYDFNGDASVTITYELHAKHVYNDGSVYSSPGYLKIVMWYDDNDNLQVKVINNKNTEGIELNLDVVIETLKQEGYAMSISEVHSFKNIDDINKNCKYALIDAHNMKIAFNRQKFNADRMHEYSDWAFIENLIDVCEQQQAYIQSLQNKIGCSDYSIDNTDGQFFNDCQCL